MCTFGAVMTVSFSLMNGIDTRTANRHELKFLCSYLMCVCCLVVAWRLLFFFSNGIKQAKNGKHKPTEWKLDTVWRNQAVPFVIIFFWPGVSHSNMRQQVAFVFLQVLVIICKAIKQEFLLLACIHTHRETQCFCLSAVTHFRNWSFKKSAEVLRHKNVFFYLNCGRLSVISLECGSDSVSSDPYPR